jgi:hypothetical protein
MTAVGLSLLRRRIPMGVKSATTAPPARLLGMDERSRAAVTSEA